MRPLLNGSTLGGQTVPEAVDRKWGSRRAIIAALVSAKATDTDERIAILTAALAARGIVVVASLVQRRGVSRARSPGGSKRLDTPMSSATFIGPGKADELARLVREHEANLVLVLNSLSLAQSERLASLTGCSVVPCMDPASPLLPER
jgi:50S ribosomal subunit-associated GTPase HflX